MKYNLIEIKKLGILNTQFHDIVIHCLDNWNYRDGIEWQTLLEYKFVKKNLIDLKEIELYDDLLFQIVFKVISKNYIMKVSENIDNKIDVNKLSLMTQEEIMSQFEVESKRDIESNSIYYKSLQQYGFLNKNGEIKIDFFDGYPNLKAFFVNECLIMIKNYGIDWNIDIYNFLIKIGVIV